MPIIRSHLPIVRIFLVPYLVILLLFITMTGVGSAWLYLRARQAQSELLIHGLLQTVTPILNHVAHSNISHEIEDKTSWLHRELNAVFVKIPELERVNVESAVGGFHKYHDRSDRLMTQESVTKGVGPGQDLRSSTAPRRLYSESAPLLRIDFIAHDGDAGPIHITFGFNRATLQDAVTRAIAILRQSIALFFALGTSCLIIALGITIWAAKKSRWLEARMQEIYRKAEAAELMSGLVHDLRNPLASLRANLASLRILPQESGEIIDEMGQDLVRLDDKLSSMLDLTKKRDEKPKKVQLDALLTQIERLAGPVFKEHNLEFQWQSSVPEPVLIMENGLRDVLLNLVINAAESGQQSGVITCSVQKKNGNLLFAIKDRGCGIPQDTDIFAPFVTTKDTGHGLGLAISRRTIEAHGGHIRVTARKNKGTTFTIILPQPPQMGIPA